MQTPYAEVALNDVALYEDIVNHRRKFYHVGYVDYDKELPQSIQIVPSDALLPSYEADYNEMRGSFIYGESLDFSALMKEWRNFKNVSARFQLNNNYKYRAQPKLTKEATLRNVPQLVPDGIRGVFKFLSP